MITIGVDAHKRIHVAVAVDEAGRILGSSQIANNPGSWQELSGWARGLGAPRQWGVEGSGSYGRGLAQHLVAAGETVHEVNPRLTAAGRRRARRSDKNDGLDARAVAMAVLREGPGLPQVAVDDETAVLDLLTTERETLVRESTALCNRMHKILLQLDPEYGDKLPRLGSKGGVKRLLRYSAREGSPLQQARAAMVRMYAKQVALVLKQAEDVERQVREAGGGQVPAPYRTVRRWPADCRCPCRHPGSRQAVRAGRTACGLWRCCAPGGVIGGWCAPQAQPDR